MPDWLAPIIAFFARLFSPSRPADSHHNPSVEARDHANIDQTQFHIENYHEAPKQGPEPKERPLRNEERELLSHIDPAGHFLLDETNANPGVSYRGPSIAREISEDLKNKPWHQGVDPNPHNKIFRKPDDPKYATRFIEALQSLVKRNLISRSGAEPHTKYRLTSTGHKAAQELQADSSPDEPTPLSREEHDLLSLIEPGGCFLCGEALTPYVTYRYPDGRSHKFNRPDVKAAYVRALQALARHELLKKDNDFRYTLTDAGIEFKKSMPPPSE